MAIKLWYRADSRSLDQIGTAGGFKSWQNTTVEEGRALVKVLMGLPDDGVASAITEYLKGSKKLKTLLDMSTYIKYTKDRSTTWVSAAMNDQCGGQASGSPIYLITVDVSEYNIVRGQLVSGHRTSNLKPCIIMDNESLESAKIIALVHGPIEDAEASFLTPIPSEFITRS